MNIPDVLRKKWQLTLPDGEPVERGCELDGEGRENAVGLREDLFRGDASNVHSTALIEAIFAHNTVVVDLGVETDHAVLTRDDNTATVFRVDDTSRYQICQRTIR